MTRPRRSTRVCSLEVSPRLRASASTRRLRSWSSAFSLAAARSASDDDALLVPDPAGSTFVMAADGAPSMIESLPGRTLPENASDSESFSAEYFDVFTLAIANITMNSAISSVTMSA